MKLQNPCLPKEKHMKWVALILLVLQNTALVLLMRSSLISSSEHYIVTTAVASMELLKVAACLIIEGWAFESFPAFFKHLHAEVLRPMELAKLSVPSLLYTLQNNLLYIALANLDAATYQVCYQLKILTTALFSVLLLKRVLPRSKWMSLLVLTIGVSLTELDASGAKGRNSSRQQENAPQNPILGLVCVFMACVTSGFAGVWFEKVLKTSRTSMWVRNIQMGFTSVTIAFVAVCLKDLNTVRERGFFYGYNRSVLGVIMLQAFGGLVVALVVRYADNILKGFGSSVSIVISCIVEWMFLDFNPSGRFVLGAGLVNWAVYLYAFESRKPAMTLLPTLSKDELTVETAVQIQSPAKINASRGGQNDKSWTHEVESTEPKVQRRTAIV